MQEGKINYPAVVVAALVTFVLAALWYSPLLFGPAYLRLSSGAAAAAGPMAAWKILEELLRHLIIAYVLARLIGCLGDVDWKRALKLGAWVWIGFPVTLLGGSVMWESVPWQLAAIHAGDWLMKILLMAVILGAWRGPKRAMA